MLPSNPVIRADLDFDHANDQSCFRNLPLVAAVAGVLRCDVILKEQKTDGLWREDSNSLLCRVRDPIIKVRP